MKQCKWLLILLLLPLGAHAQSAVQFNWTGDGNTGMPACPATTPKSCVSGYTLTDITVATAPVVLSSAIAETALTYTESPLPSVGSHTWSLVVNGYDQSGNAISSAPVTVTATVPSITLNPPTGFTAVP